MQRLGTFIQPVIYVIKSIFVDFYVHRQLREVGASSLVCWRAAQCCLFQLSQATENFCSSAFSPISCLPASTKSLSLSPPVVRLSGRQEGNAAVAGYTALSEEAGVSRGTVKWHYLRSNNRSSVLQWSPPSKVVRGTCLP